MRRFYKMFTCRRLSLEIRWERGAGFRRAFRCPDRKRAPLFKGRTLQRLGVIER